MNMHGNTDIRQKIAAILNYSISLLNESGINITFDSNTEEKYRDGSDINVTTKLVQIFSQNFHQLLKI